MSLHVIEPERATLHGHFDRDLPPVVTVDPGDTVRFRTLIAGWDIEPPASADEEGPKFSPRQKGLDDGHALCGPVAVRGAEPGMVLEVRIECVEPDHWGWSTGGGWENDLNKRLGVAGGDNSSHLWSLDTVNRIGRSQSGHSLALSPFMGVLGMPPAEAGVHNTWHPRVTGGNLDCKELVAGSVLFLPVAVPGGLFSTGDGHAVQGDGEVSGVAIECPMKRVDLTLDLRTDLELAAPRALTAEGWLTMGLDEDLNEAAFKALDGMLDHMTQSLGMSRKEAVSLASLVVDLRITQIVNGTRGVHAVLPHGAIR